ncbi:hypothetical protein JJD66_21800 [Pseudomonas sp. MF6751]|uniref:hypothetical protein n=1 Tax=Pseudomonas sp. MF6751 TaxID=2797528 RepID=UPI00190A87FA|nr:hypothetical protein [Pseudomonas sp. MF6751]MBK3478725.1 hypothetical protein [Pseudomonas sp. MF6751]
MAFNTGNPVEPNGSADPRDLKDNAPIFDKLINGSDLTRLGRLGKVLKTWAGMTKAFDDLLANSGYESTPVVYAAGATVQRSTQLIVRSGVYYRVTDPANFPLTLTGDWSVDALKLTDVADGSLRSALAAIGGSMLVNLRGIAQNVLMQTDDSSDNQYTLHTIRTTNLNSDTIFTERVATGSSSTGYAIHALDSGDGATSSGDGGGAIGGATSRNSDASAIVGNRRATGPGHGGIFSRLESGNGNGAHGFRAGTGAGNGVYGYLVQGAQGHGVRGTHEGTASGAGVFGERLNGAGPGPGVMGHAAGQGALEDASVFGYKLSGDYGYAILADARGRDAAIRAFAALTSTAKAVESLTDVTCTAPTSNTFERDYGAQGFCVLHRVNGATARTGPVIATVSTVAPTANSTGTSTVTGHALTIGSNVSGSSEACGATYDVLAKDGVSAFGAKAVVNGTNTTNYGMYANAVGGTTNWSGYFVGNVFYGGTLSPSDARLKTIHGEVDYAQCLENVIANPVYCYDKEAAYMAPVKVWDEEIEDREGTLFIPTYGEEEQRQLVAVREIGNLAQDIQKTNPDFITEYAVGDTNYLSISDRSELFQLKAAVKYLVERLRSEGVDV